MSVIAVTGATGYIGGRLIPLLLKNGHQVRVLTRLKDALRDVPWSAEVETIEGDLTDLRAAQELCRESTVLYYLAHSMGGVRDFVPLEERCERTIVRAAQAEGVERIIYLSGLHPSGEFSRHLSSRAKVGEILASNNIPTITLHAGPIIGAGSASFEIIRHLTDVLPFMPAPHWVLNRVQPIAVRDALHYLSRAAELPAGASGVFDIGGPAAHSYGDMMRLYADAARIHRPVIWALPVLTPWMAAQWVNLVTPIPRSLAISLVESLQHYCEMRNRDIDAIIERPAGGLTEYRKAVELALANMEADSVGITWATAHALEFPAEMLPSDPQWAGHTVYTDVRQRETFAAPSDLFTVIQAIGGGLGYYSLPGAWAVRGFLDKLAGVMGLHRRMRSRQSLALGDALDWWRVEELVPNELLRLRAEIRLPGSAWLELSASPTPTGSIYRQRAVFFPHGLAGRLYWLSMLPFHGVIFSSIARRMTTAAENLSEVNRRG